MLIRNITSSRDLENKKMLQAEMLQAQIDNEKILDERVRDYKNPNKPPAVPPQYKSNSEVLEDSLEQQKQAIENLRSLGLGFDVAAQTSIELKNLPDGIANLVKLNKNFPFIKTDILKRYNVKLLDPQVLKEYFKEYFDEIDNIIGISIPSTSSTNYFDKGVSTSLIATKDDYTRLNAALDVVSEKSNINKSQINELKRAADKMASISPTDTQLQSINTFDMITRNKLKKEMEKLMKKYPSGKNINEITDKLNNQIKEVGVDTFALANAKAGGIDVSQDTPESVYKILSIFRRLLKNINELEQLTDFTEKLKGQEDELKQKESSFYEKFDKGESKGEELTEVVIPKEIVEYQEQLSNDIIKRRQNIGVLNKSKKKTEETEEQLEREKTKLKEAERNLIKIDERERVERERIEKELKNEARNKKKQDIKDYLNDRVAGLMYGNMKDRIEMSPTVRGEFANFNPYINYYEHSPTIDYLPPNKDKTNVIYEIIRDEDGNLIELDKKIFKNGKELDLKFFPFDNFLYVEIGSKYKIDEDSKKIGKITQSGAYFRYGKDRIEELRDIIKRKEIPLLYQRIDNDENYDPREEKYQRRVMDGFGLTNNIIKHFNKDNKDMEKLSKSLKKHLKVEEKVDGPKKKGGAVDFSAKRIKIGKGLAPMEKEPIHKEFGKYIINIKQLKSGYLNLKHPSGSQIPSIPTVEVSKNYREFVLDVLDNSKVNQRHYDILTNAEKAHFTNITKKAKLFDVLDFKAEENEEEKKDLERLELLFGEYNAGNDNPKMIKECKALIKKYIANGRIEQSRGLNMLMELD